MKPCEQCRGRRRRTPGVRCEQLKMPDIMTTDSRNDLVYLFWTHENSGGFRGPRVISCGRVGFQPKQDHFAEIVFGHPALF